MSGSWDSRPVGRPVTSTQQRTHFGQTQQPGGGGGSAKVGSVSYRPLTIAENFYRRASEANGGNESLSARRAHQTKKKSGGMSGVPPQMLICYLCGRQFGTASLSIHQSQCYYKCLIQWERGDPDFRGPKPIHPDEYRNMPEDERSASAQPGMTARDAFNDREYAKFSEQMLVPCDICGRRFLPDRLVVHKRSCKDTGGPPHATARSRSASNLTASRRSDTPTTPKPSELIPCPSCGRRYIESKLIAHINLCKGNVPTQAEMQRHPPPPPPAQGSSIRSSSNHRSGSPGRVVALHKQRDRSDQPTEYPTSHTGNSLAPCRFCKRSFNPNRLEKHESVCVERKKKVSYYADPTAPKMTPKVAYDVQVDIDPTPVSPPRAAPRPTSPGVGVRSAWNIPTPTSTSTTIPIVRLASVAGSVVVSPRSVSSSTGNTAEPPLYDRYSPRSLMARSPPRRTNSPPQETVTVMKMSATTNSGNISVRSDPKTTRGASVMSHMSSSMMDNDSVAPEYERRPPPQPSQVRASQQFPKFCQECGYKFQGAVNFCQECGFRCVERMKTR